MQFAKHTPISLTSIAATLTLNPASIKHQDFETLQSESLANSAPLQATSPSANGKDAGTDFLLESSLQFQDLGFTAQAYSTRHSTYNGYGMGIKSHVVCQTLHGSRFCAPSFKHANTSVECYC